MGPPFYMVIRVTWRSSRCRAKEVPSFLSYFKTLSIGLAPGNEPATSLSEVKHSIDWTNPAKVNHQVQLVSSQLVFQQVCFTLYNVRHFMWELENTMYNSKTHI